jgi:hypothetical protein
MLPDIAAISDVLWRATAVSRGPSFVGRYTTKLAKQKASLEEAGFQAGST